MRAEREGKWLLANLQRGDDFASHVLNRNIWTNDHVKEVVRANFSVFQGATSLDLWPLRHMH